MQNQGTCEGNPWLVRRVLQRSLKTVKSYWKKNLHIPCISSECEIWSYHWHSCFLLGYLHLLVHQNFLYRSSTVTKTREGHYTSVPTAVTKANHKRMAIPIPQRTGKQSKSTLRVRSQSLTIVNCRCFHRKPRVGENAKLLRGAPMGFPQKPYNSYHHKMTRLHTC